MERIGLEPGSEIGGYTIVAPLGSGGMGTVYRALDGGGSPVALKLLHPHIGADPAARERLRREVLALQRLRHPGVAAVLDAEADSTEAFIVTELIAGDNLEEHVRVHGPLDADELLELAEGLRGALTAVHAAGVVHRDLKPSNVLVTDAGPVLIDFGIAQAADDPRATSTGLVVGTPGYLAPELLDDADPTAQSDWWGWAALLAYAATGRAPFGLRPLEQVLARARAGQPDLVGVGPLTAGALRGALVADPTRRLAPDDVLAALQVASVDGDVLDDVPEGMPDDALATTVMPPRATTTQLIPNDGSTRAFAPRDRGRDDRRTGTDTSGASDADGAGDDDGPDDWGTGDLGPAAYDAPGGEPYGGLDYERPPAHRRWGSTFALGLAAVAACALYPGVTVVVLALLLVAVRTVGATVESMYDRRERLGVRRGDRVRAVVSTPWHLLRALAGLIPSVIVGTSVVVIILGAMWWLVGSGRVDLGTSSGGEPTGTTASVLVGGAFMVGLVAIWWGPLSATTRIGARRALAVVAPGRAGALVVVLVALAGAAVLVLRIRTGTTIEWDPLPAPTLP